jgi:hypothetical protein
MSETRHYAPSSDTGGRHWAIIAKLVQSAKLNGVEPLVWLTDVLKRIVSGRIKRHELGTLLPWNWNAAREAEAAETGVTYQFRTTTTYPPAYSAPG